MHILLDIGQQTPKSHVSVRVLFLHSLYIHVEVQVMYTHGYLTPPTRHLVTVDSTLTLSDPSQTYHTTR